MRNPPWLKDEIILVMDFYMDNSAKIPGKDSDQIAALSALLNDFRNMHGLHGDAKFRNINGVHMKIMNLRGLDEQYDGKGLSSASNADREVWSSYKEDNTGLKSTANIIRNYIESNGGSKYDIDRAIDDEIEQEAQEGRLVTRIHKQYERDSKIVKNKKDKVLEEKGTLECEVCKFNFLAIYGDRGHNFIECHHNKPVSEIGDRGVTKLSDLAILCSNCHRMIHRSRPWLTVYELRNIYEQQVNGI